MAQPDAGSGGASVNTAGASAAKARVASSRDLAKAPSGVISGAPINRSGSVGSASRASMPTSAKRAVRKQRPAGSFAVRLTLLGDRLAFSWQVRRALYRHLTAQHVNEVPLEKALDNFAARLKRNQQRTAHKIVTDVSRRMKDGSTLSGALAKWVPTTEASIIESGESAGKVAQALELVVEVKELIDRVRNAIKRGLTAPAIYVVAIYAMLWTIGHFVLPGISQVMPANKAQGLVYLLYLAGDFANSWYMLLPPVMAIVLAFTVIRSLPRWTGPWRIIAERYFPYSFYRDIEGFAWLMSFTALVRAGMSEVEILERQKTGASPWLHERLHALWWRMVDGASLSAAILAPGRKGIAPFGFPNPDIADDIASLSGFGDSADRIAKLAAQWAVELEAQMLAKAKRIGAAVELFMYAVMLFLMIAINSLSTQMGTGTGI